MDTDAVAVFVAAASAGSLSAAARRLAVAPMAATRRLAALEKKLGIRLMQRTTRSVSLTPEGELFLPFAQAMLNEEAAARASLAPAGAGASGLLRVTAPAAFGRKVIAPLIPTLLAAHPALRIDLDVTDQVVDIVSAGIDVAIRIAPMRDSSLIAKRLAPNPRVLCAAPSYLARHPAPKTLDDLTRHDCLTLTGVTHWPFETDGAPRRVRISGRFSSNSIEGLREACARGGGLSLLSTWDVRDDVRSGALVTLDLADGVPQDLAVWAVYPTARLVLPKLRAFVAALEAALARG